MEENKKLYPSFLHRISPPAIMFLGFSIIILIGAFLLMLPISSATGDFTNFLDCLFTATSATCVTGLAVVETSIHWSFFGKFIIIVLIQIGGLGFMSIGASFAVFLGRKINLHERILIKESLNQNEISGAVRLIRNVIKFTFIIEMLGAIVLSTVFIPKLGVEKGIGYSIFHSVSAFCNAGFDLMGKISKPFSSMESFYDNLIVNFTLTSLIIIGGIGFGVMICIRRNHKFRDYDLSSKLAVITTVILILAGTFLIFVGEFSNPDSIGSMAVKDKFLVSYFQSVTTRTAGFATIDLTTFREGTIFLMMVLMFIGASPASSGGGIKTTTVAILFLTLKSFFKNEKEITIFHKRINEFVIRKATGILVIAITLVSIATYLLTITQGDAFDLKNSAFEAISAFATVGLSIGGTPNLDSFGRLIIIFLMFAGRVGSLTVFSLLIHETKAKSVRYPEGKVIVG